MENEIKNNKEWILHEFRDILETRIKINIFKHGNNINLSKKIHKMFGYTLDLQPDYKVIKSDSLQPFIWIGRGFPYRWVTIHKSEKSKYIKKDEAWDQLTKEFADLMPHIRIGNYMRSVARHEYCD